MAASSSEIRTAAGLIRLATGGGGADWSSLSWRDVAALATRERCIALAWLRSRDVILRHADTEVAEWWRNLALRTLARGHAHLDTLSGLTRAFHDVGVPCAILKGAPLSALLYGEPGARASADLDLWISLQDRPRAREILLDDGWQHADGEAPYDEAYRKPGPHGENYLEVHSTLLHSRLSYLPLPSPEVATVEIAGVVLPVMGGALLPVYLAVHIARHRSAPLLWFIDHRTLWQSLDEAGQALARWTARRCRAERYLDWVLRRADSLEPASRGERVAITGVGLGTHRRDRHPMWRQIQLAPLPDGPFRALGAWLVPPWVTSTAFRPAHAVQRVRRHWRSAIGTVSPTSRTASSPTIAPREVTLAGPQLLRVARDVSGVGGRMWITTTGTSMFPTLADRDTVLLEPPSRVAVGDIVLVDHGGSPLLHRIVQLQGDQILTRGDARMTPDASLSRRDIIAQAVRARRGNREWSLTPSPWRRLRMRISSARGRRMAVASCSAPV